MTEACLRPTGTATARATADAMAARLPRIVTDRLILRAPRLSDWEALEPIWTSDRAAGFGGPFTPEEAWLDFNQMVASWFLRGYGPLTLTDRDSGAVLGIAGFDHEWGDPEPEMGWLLTEAAEGRGLAREAAAALLAEGSARIGTGGFAAYVDGGHPRSARVAEAIGLREDAAPHPAEAKIRVFRQPGEER